MSKTVTENLKLQVKRVIKAKRPAVFEAWIKPEVMKKWFAPGDMKVPSVTSDAREGGSYRVVMEGAPGTFTVSSIYRKIVPNELLSFTWAWEGSPDEEMVVTVLFQDVDGGTQVTIAQEGFASTESAGKHEHGWTSCLENLAKVTDG